MNNLVVVRRIEEVSECQSAAQLCSWDGRHRRKETKNASAAIQATLYFCLLGLGKQMCTFIKKKKKKDKITYIPIAQKNPLFFLVFLRK